MTTKLEEIARALFADEFPDEDFDSIDEIDRMGLFGHARAMLEALKNPTQEMMEAGVELDCGLGKYDCRDAFNAMIQSVLDEKP